MLDAARFAAVGDLPVPVMPLGHEIAFYELLGRAERATRLRALLADAPA